MHVKDSSSNAAELTHVHPQYDRHDVRGKFTYQLQKYIFQRRLFIRRSEDTSQLDKIYNCIFIISPRSLWDQSVNNPLGI